MRHNLAAPYFVHGGSVDFHAEPCRSPHLINVEERIRVDGKPVGRDLFAEHFWLLYDKFSENAVCAISFIYSV